MASLDNEKRSRQKKKKQPGENLGFEPLPYEIVLDIITRLHAKSVGRLKCTSKSWNKKLKDPKFVQDHLSHSIENRSSYLLVTMDRFSSVQDVHYGEEAASGFEVEPVRLLRDVCKSEEQFDICVSSGGLMAYYHSLKNCFHIWNPITGENVELPAHKGCPMLDYLWGFGYSLPTKQYKIVTIKTRRPLVTVTYTIGSKSWRHISNAPFRPHGFQVDVNGILFWFIWGKGKNIMSFDVTSEEFETWQGPPVVIDYELRPFAFELIKVGDNVAVVQKTSLDYNIWVLKDKVSEIWVNEYHIVPEFLGMMPRDVYFAGLWMNGDILGIDKHSLTCVAFDYKSRQLKVVKSMVNGHECCSGDRSLLPGRIDCAIPCAASLVSPVRLLFGPRANQKYVRLASHSFPSGNHFGKKIKLIRPSK